MKRPARPCREEPTRSCSFLIDREKLVATCHRCGRQIPFDPVPVDPAAAHVIADIRGDGLRSVR